jgi:FMN phosphatase YigB (HAD superfamily)
MLGCRMTISVVFFDVGETLTNEARLWDGWAAYLGIPVDEFRSAFIDVIASGEHHRKVFERFRPGFDLVKARQERSTCGDVDVFDASDVYPDALPCLRRLRASGYVVGIAGNQPREAQEALIAYVGDRLDNDVLPARDAGMAAIFIKRGPWGALHATRPDIARATAVIDSLAQLPDVLGGINGQRRTSACPFSPTLDIDRFIK